jgi:hypothetical protein
VLELIGGEIFEKTSPQKGPRATAICLVEAALRRAYVEETFVLRVQLPLALGDAPEPDPDLALVRGAIRDFAVDHPTAALLVVEVADTTLAFDRSVKASMYASAGIAHDWIVNLADRVLEVHAEPAAMAEQPFGSHYRSVSRVPPGGRLAIPETAATVAVADLLP